jgi:hypothetical protein
MIDPEAEADELLGDERDDAPGARALVARHLGSDAIVVLRNMRGRDAELVKLHGRYVVCVRAKLSPSSLRWALLHELAEWHLARAGYREPDIERQAERITAALVAPRRPFRWAVREEGDRAYESLARGFVTTETSVARRLGEVEHRPVAVVAPTHVHVAGPEHWEWGDVRALVRADRPGLAKVRLSDDRRRLVLLVEDDAETG